MRPRRVCWHSFYAFTAQRSQHHFTYRPFIMLPCCAPRLCDDSHVVLLLQVDSVAGRLAPISPSSWAAPPGLSSPPLKPCIVPLRSSARSGTMHLRHYIKGLLGTAHTTRGRTLYPILIFCCEASATRPLFPSTHALPCACDQHQRFFCCSSFRS